MIKVPFHPTSSIEAVIAKQGYKAFKDGRAVNTSSYVSTIHRDIWISGWIEARDNSIIIPKHDFNGDKNDPGTTVP